MSLKLYFCIVSTADVPLFETSLGTEMPQDTQKTDLVQFIVHAALDIVDQRAAATPAMFLKGIDKFNDMTVSSFVTASGARMLLLHDERYREQDVKHFFEDAYEGYVRLLMNPFHDPAMVFYSAPFENRLVDVARKVGWRT